MKNLRYLTCTLLLLALFLVGCGSDLTFTVTILTPFDGSSFESGEEITFTGFALDSTDGELSGDSLIWTSNIGGEIGTGTTFTKNDLSE